MQGRKVKIIITNSESRFLMLSLENVFNTLYKTDMNELIKQSILKDMKAVLGCLKRNRKFIEGGQHDRSKPTDHPEHITACNK